MENNAIKLLLVEDSPDILEIVEQILAPYFTSIIKSQSGAEGLALAQEERDIKLVISDINMPEMDGVEFITKLRAQGIHVPVIFLTGNGTKETLLAAVRLGVVDIVEKPFDMAHLRQTVTRVLEIEKRKAQLHQAEAFGEEPSDLEKEKKMLGLLQAVNVKK